MELSPGSYEVGRRGLMPRRPAAEALERMAAAARADGVILVASSIACHSLPIIGVTGCQDTPLP